MDQPLIILGGALAISGLNAWLVIWLVSGLRDDIKETRRELKEAVSGVRDELKDAVSDVRDELKDARGESKEAVSGLRGELKEAVSEIKGDLKDARESRRRLSDKIDLHFRLICQWLFGRSGSTLPMPGDDEQPVGVDDIHGTDDATVALDDDEPRALDG